MYSNRDKVHNELYLGGRWLAASRMWLQSNIKGGDTLSWSATESVQIPFCKFEELALKIAIAAVMEERERVALKKKVLDSRD